MTATASADRLRPMLGHLLARVVFVEGVGGTTLTDAERRKLLKYVETATRTHLTELHNRWRVKQQPPVRQSCRFTVTSERVTIDLDPATLPPPTNAKKAAASDFEAIDAKWIDAALETLGHSKTDRPRLEDRVGDLLADAVLEQLFGGVSPDDAFVVFVTKYPCHWMAYAKPELGFCTLCPPMLDVGGWKDRHDLVAAHETGHVFGAPDEYVAPHLTCNPIEAAGPFRVLNRNCELNNPKSVKCMMRRSDVALCDETPLHWGWLDFDGDGILDLLAPPTIDLLTVIDPFGAAIPDCHAGAPGWTVGIKGRNVWDARVVTFGGVPAPRVWVDALDEIHVTVPEDVFGIVTISLVTRAGTSQSTFEQSWFLVAQPVVVPSGPPLVFGLLPSSGPAGTAVTILGADLMVPTSIRFGRVFADLSTLLPPLDFRSPTTVTVTAPPGPSGPVPVVVTSDKGSSQPWLLSTFVYT